MLYRFVVPEFVYRIKPMVMVVALAASWFGYDCLVKGRLDNAILPDWLNYAFLVYCLHWPLTVLTVRLPKFILGVNDFIALFITIGSTVLLTFGCVCIVSILRRVNPDVLFVLSGGRCKGK